MKRSPSPSRRRLASSLPYLMVALASVLFAGAQPSSSVAPETVAVALADSWSADSSPEFKDTKPTP
ncbi:hypothetical protein SNE35_12805 [Paucibacter sp. R3-3]|uniref:Uncharacterized protein n=1 Tax=Roseateles agri TaxID=3098619 RepID=A0ABU5DJH3_9BURK|nr:hypothetical protein [Paucibacter sp. R3-3]MDY0745394.1 hypothetical protein [Paucibacter sp. R3-3]